MRCTRARPKATSIEYARTKKGTHEGKEVSQKKTVDCGTERTPQRRAIDEGGGGQGQRNTQRGGEGE